MKRPIRYLITLILPLLPLSARAEVIITPMAGYQWGGKVEDQNGNHFDINGSESFALSAETTFEQGRLGLFYARQNTEVDQLKNHSRIHYLQFQSSIYYPASENSAGYIGLGIGGSYLDVSWARHKSALSASLFGGYEYRIAENMALTAQLRWLGTLTGSKASAVCDQSASESCIVRFESDWINQFALYTGIEIRF